MIRRILGCFVLCGLVASASLQAHHPLAGLYDLKNEVEVKGTLTKVVFTNPHSAIHISVRGADGATVEWKLTTGSASTLAGLGFGNGPNPLLKAGDAVTIKIFPALSGKPLGYIRSITLANNKEVQLPVSTFSRPEF
jgi:hypothetical protein